MTFLKRVVLLLLLLFTVTVEAYALTAGFKADNTSGCAPLVVHFTNTSTGATSYYWDLGNGTTSSLKDVSGSYLTAGTYTVKMTATGGGSTATYTMTITVYPTPVVSFTASPTTTCAGMPITFTSTTSGGTPGPMTYLWNFGDGTLSTAATPSHAYGTVGVYRVTLSVTNSMGCVSTLSMPAYITIVAPPKARFTAAPTRFCDPPASVLFTNTSTGTGTLSYSWTFGDGGVSGVMSPSHNYTSNGSYTVTLSVKDANGCVDNVTVPGDINIGHITASFAGPASACEGTLVTFTNLSSPTPVSSKWYYGDGGTSTGGAHTYTAPGTYTVKLVAFDGTCYDSITRSITIVAGPTASITQSNPKPCPAPTSITFTGVTTPATTMAWSFGDGTTGAGSPVTHAYGSPGIYVIIMTATDPTTGCSTTTSVTDTIYDMDFHIKASPLKGCAPLTVNFDITALTTQPDPSKPAHPYPYLFTGYSWNFGDGSPLGTTAKPSHTYTSPGTYKAFVTVTTSNGCTFSDTITILVSAPPVITATATPTHVCYGRKVHIAITVLSGPVDDFYWNFGGPGGVPPDTNKSGVIDITFPLPGVYTVTVSASYHGCMSAPYILPIPIIVDSPMAIMNTGFSCANRMTVTFTDKSLGDDTHLWIFGDGTTSTVKNPVHTYPSPGSYNVMLATYNATSGCRDTTYQSIDLSTPSFDFTVDHAILCPGGIVNITPKIISGTISSLDWYLNGAYAGPGTPPSRVLTLALTTPGYYTVTLTALDQLGCVDTMRKTNYIQVVKPTAHFSATPMVGCSPLPVKFTDASTAMPGTSLVSYSWRFGDGGSAVLSTPGAAHTYTVGGGYTVTETVTDNIGCMDSIHVGPIDVHSPNVAFTVSNRFPCPYTSVAFTNTTIGAVTAFWDFGDGTTSTAISPTHVYGPKGAYTVKLVVTNSFGCVDSLVAPAYINVSKPIAAFNMTDSFSICPPISITFNNTSGSGATSYQWYFGDGNSSTKPSPSDVYTSPGHDTVLLIATDAKGCRDTMTKYVDIFGYNGAFSYSPLTGCAPLNVHFKSALTNVPNIVWDFADGTTSPTTTIDSIDHVYTIPGAYVPKLVMSDNTGCENSSMGLDTIKVDDVYIGFTTEPSPVCEHVSVTIKDTSFSYFSTITDWTWTFSDGSTSTLKAPGYTFPQAGVYTISMNAKDGWGCTNTGKEDIIVYPPPLVTTSPDSTICLTDAATLTAYGAVSYSWDPPATLSCANCNPTFASPRIVTTYTVTGTDKHGCKNTSDVTVRLKTKTVSKASGDTATCFGKIVPLLDSGATRFNWIPAKGLNDPFSGSPLASPEETTNYMVVAQLGSCIPDTNFVKVTVYPVPVVDAGPDQTILAGTTADIKASGSHIASISWGHDSTLSCDNCMIPRATPFQTTTYVIHVASSDGCPNTDTIIISTYCDKGQIFMPNTFTPNGDGENDLFYPRGRGISIVKSFRIYNRWGQLLFERSNIQLNDATNGWDGTYNGDIPRPDVFVYVVEALCTAGDQVNLKGDVTIIR